MNDQFDIKNIESVYFLPKGEVELKQRKDRIEKRWESTGEIIGYEYPKYRTKAHTYYYSLSKLIIKEKIHRNPSTEALINQMGLDNMLFANMEMYMHIHNEYGISVSALQKEVARMVEKEMAIKIASAHYMVNPYYFVKSNPDKFEKLQVEWDRLLLGVFKKEVQKDKDISKNVNKQIKSILSEPLKKIGEDDV